MKNRAYADHAATTPLLPEALKSMVLCPNDGFALPPLAEQQRIVKRLDEVLKLVEAGQGGAGRAVESRGKEYKILWKRQPGCAQGA